MTALPTAFTTASMTLGQCCAEWLALNKPRFRPSTFQFWNYAFRKVRASAAATKLVGEVTREDIIALLEQNPPAARPRFQWQLVSVFEWAKVRGWVDVNPAKFRLNDYMAQPKHIVQHVASMDWHEAPAFMSKLQAIKTVSSLCVQWIMLTAARPMQGCGARWDEIDLERKLWLIPGSRMKQKRDHVVPLSSQALDVLAKLRRIGRTGPWLFPARETHYHSQTIREKFIPIDVSLHGFRSTFANWCVEQGYSVQLIDLSLSHLVGGTVIIRSNMVEQRAPLMQAWADFLDSAPPEPDLAERITANPIIRKSGAAEARGG